MLYTLTYYQVVNQLCACGTLSAALQTASGRDAGSGLAEAARLLLGALDGHHLLDDEGTAADTAHHLDAVELEVRRRRYYTYICAIVLYVAVISVTLPTIDDQTTSEKSRKTN